MSHLRCSVLNAEMLAAGPVTVRHGFFVFDECRIVPIAMMARSTARNQEVGVFDQKL